MIYKMQIPPFPVKSFDLLTTRQAKEIFKWYTDDIPARLDQLQKCIDADVNGTVQLTRGKYQKRNLSIHYQVLHVDITIIFKLSINVF